MVEHTTASVVQWDGTSEVEDVVYLQRYQRQLHNADYWYLTEEEGQLYDDLFGHIWALRSEYQYKSHALKAIAVFLNHVKTPIQHFIAGQSVALEDFCKSKETSDFIWHLFDTHIVATTTNGQAFVEECLSHGSKRRLNVAHDAVYVVFGKKETAADSGMFGTGLPNPYSALDVTTFERSREGWNISGGGTLYLNYGQDDIVVGAHNSSASSNATLGFTIKPSTDAVENSGYLHFGRFNFLHADGSSGSPFIAFKVHTSDPNKLEYKIKYDNDTAATGSLTFPQALWPPDGEPITLYLNGQWDWHDGTNVGDVVQPLQIWLQTSTYDSDWLDLSLAPGKEFRSPKKLDQFSFRAPDTGVLTVQSIFVH